MKEQGLKAHCCGTHSPSISDVSLQALTFGVEKKMQTEKCLEKNKLMARNYTVLPLGI